MLNGKALKLGLLFAFGVLIGGSIVESAHRHDDKKMLFARKQKCETIAGVYEKKFDDLGGLGLETIILNTDYSPARNSCVAIEITLDSQTHRGTEAVVDILTDQTLFVRPYSDTEGRRKDVDEAFQKSLRSTRQP